MPAGKEYPLSIILRTIDESSAVLRSINAKFSKFGKSIDRIGKKAAKIGRSMTASMTLPIVGIGVAGIKAFADLEAGMASVSTLVDTSVVDMDAMQKKVLEIGKRTPVALGDLTAALFDLISGGATAEEAMGKLEKSAQLGVAGLGSTAEAALIATGAINSFKLEGEAADKVYDLIFKTTKGGITTIAGLKQGFGAVAGTVAATGTELDEYLAAISALTTTTRPSAQAQTQLRAALTGLARESPALSKALKKLGAKDFKDLIQKAGGLVEAFKVVSDSVGGNQDKLTKLAGGAEGYAAVMSLVGDQNDTFNSTLTDMRGGLIGMAAGFAKQNKTVRAAMQRTKNSLTIAAASIGKILLPVVEELTEKLQEASTWWENLDDETKKTIVTVAGIVAVVGPVVLILGKLAIAIVAVSGAVAKLSVFLWANPIVALAGSIALAAVVIYREWQSFEEFFELLWDGVTGIFQEAWEFIKAIVDKVAGAVDAVLGFSDAVSNIFVSDIKESKGTQAEFIAAERAKLRPAPAFDFGPAALEGSLGLAGPSGTSTIRVELPNLPLGTTVKTTSDDRTIDVAAGNQMGGL